MSNLIIIVGESGAGKSSSIRSLNHKETFLINVLDKPLPFKGYKSKYLRAKEDNAFTANYNSTDKTEDILKIINFIDKRRPDIKTIIIDDFQYVMCNEFMQKALERGFDKFSEIAKHAHSILMALSKLREDLTCFILTHSDMKDDGIYRVKTIGKILDEKIVIEGMCTIVLHAVVNDGKHEFLTQFDGRRIAKSPIGMFENKSIPNDLSLVLEKIKAYELDDSEDREESKEINLEFDEAA